MKSTVRVAAPPANPVMIYDGDCRFCELWIRRWQSATGDRIEYIPFQDPRVAAQFPEIAREQFEAAVQLIQPDGAVYAGAEAVFRSLATNRCGRWWLKGYERSQTFAGITEWSYRFVARHRQFFSLLTRLLWGRQLGPQSHQLVRWTFLRSLGIVYLIAFVSLWTQIVGLIGHNGIAPVQDLLKSVEQYVSAEHPAAERYHLLPTLCWFGAGDGSLKWQCAAGTALAILLLIGVAPAPCLFLLWLIYLSLTSAGNVFLGFQWDALLLETGFLAIFFAPLRLLPRRLSRESPPSRIVLWLLRWLLFRLMFESGVVKLTWGDATWIKLNALNIHYETQPLPTWIGWYAHQLPQWFQKSSTVVMFAIELAVPFLIFAPRRPRQLAAVVFVVFQLVILLTGNYCFFNLLTIALCLTLLDDAADAGVRSLVRRSLATNRFSPAARPNAGQTNRSAIGTVTAASQCLVAGGHAAAAHSRLVHVLRSVVRLVHRRNARRKEGAAADDEPFARIIGRGNGRHVALVEQRHLQGSGFGECPDGRRAQRRDPVEPRRSDLGIDARLRDHPAVADQHHVLDREALVDLVDLCGERARIGGVALEHLDRHRATVGRAQQAVDDLQLALLAVAVVAEPRQLAAAGLQVAR